MWDLWYILLCVLLGVSSFLAVRAGVGPVLRWLGRQERAYDSVLRQRLMLDVEPRHAVYLTLTLIGVALLFGLLVTDSWVIAAVCGGLAFFVPNLVIRHLAQSRRRTLDRQLVDALLTLSAGVRAGLNLVQAMELVARNHTGPVKQEFGQMLREYELGLDLNHAMRNTSGRIGSPLYRLMFTAIEMHRTRGGDVGESLDKIAASVRDIQRLEGKLDAVTAQSRGQANMMALMPFVFLGVMSAIDSEGVQLLFTDVVGRLLLILSGVMILAAYVWIYRIMDVDI